MEYPNQQTKEYTPYTHTDTQLRFSYIFYTYT